ncbi:MAG: hypothetical protein K2K48_00150 [Anaeroplasmataceae bacterium]|nr:hypothetical protein [Anaeroplasmataceae bacterium]
MSILEIIDNFKIEYKKIIQDFSIIDKKDPITSSKLGDLDNSLTAWTTTLKDLFVKNNKYKIDYEKKNLSHLTRYQQKIKVLNDSLNKNIKGITKDYIDACQKLRQKIEIAKKDTNYRIEQFEVELDYFLATSEQNKIILSNDFQEAKKRFDYQRDEAKESYLEIVKKNNAILKQIKEQLYEEYKKEIDELLNAQAEELEKLKKFVEIQEMELSSITTALENEKSNMKEKYRQESANLNENIKKIADEKNKIIDTARGQYTKSMNDANIERENKKAIYQAQAQALLKEFVTKINVIDENTSLIKKEFEKKINGIKREYYSDVFQKTKIFHQQLEQIYNATSALDKYTNHVVRFKNKQHQMNIFLAKKEKELILLELTKDNTIKVLNNRNDKNFLEIDKNYAIKNINDQEQFDNKYYQENDNIYGNDFNYTVKNANYRFSQQANILRCQSQIRTKLLERNYDGISANYYKKIETIQNKINSYKLAIDATQKLNSIVLQYLEETYKAHLHHEETNNLLEIEKNKLLKEYNRTQYEHNIQDITLAKEYGFKKIDLENQKALEQKNLRIVLENLIMEKNSVSAIYSIKREELNEHFAKIKTQIINNNDLRVSKEEYVTNLLDNDVHYLENLVHSYSTFFNSLKRNYLNIVGVVLEDIFPNEDNFHYLESLLNKFLELFLIFIRNVIVDFQECISSVLTEKMEYIYTFKYKSSLDSLEEQHEKDITMIKEKKNAILDEIDSSNKTIENFRQKIYTLINDNEMLIHNNQQRKKKLDPATQVILKQTELKIKDYKEKIEDFTKMIHMRNDDLSELNQHLSSKNSEYKNELQKIQRMIKTDIAIFTQYKNSVGTNLKTIDLQLQDFINNHLMHASSAKKFLSETDASQKRIQKIMTNAKNIILRDLDSFIRESEQDTAKRKLNCALEFKNEVKEFNQKYNKATYDYLTEYHETIATHEKKIEEQTILLNQMMDLYDHKLDIANQNFQNDSNTLDAYHQQIRNQFFASYYALDDNYQKILDYHQNLSLEKENQFKKDKDDIQKDKVDQLNRLNLKLKHFIKTKNEEIEHLPIAFKFNSKMLNKETKKKNIQLHEDMKLAKTEYNLQNKHIEKNIRSLKTHLAQDKFQNEMNQKRNIAREKKNNIVNLKQSIKSIKINL